MKVHIKKTNVDLSSEQEDYIYKKIGELENFISSPNSEVEAWINVGRPSAHHGKGNVFETTVDLHLPGKTFRAESQGPDLFSTVTDVKDELQVEVKKFKGKMIDQQRKGMRLFKSIKNLNWMSKDKE